MAGRSVTNSLWQRGHPLRSEQANICRTFRYENRHHVYECNDPSNVENTDKMRVVQ